MFSTYEHSLAGSAVTWYRFPTTQTYPKLSVGEGLATRPTREFTFYLEAGYLRKQCFACINNQLRDGT